ncbi:alpha/beta hydrolase [Nocardioides sp. LHG3406-4]|uniref:alpha/beta hydrolase n=1 Tax=Nocardioides sp. LHG3406-4 TaxID=2804575 RepID=UPI003CEFDD8D
MTQIDVPAKIAQIAELEAKAGASSITTALRASATALSDVATWTTSHGAPADWTGDAAEAADHAMTAFGKDADAVTAALEKATGACDTYVDQVVQLTADREGLEADRIELNNDIDALLAEIESSTEEDVPALQTKAQTLRSRATTMRGGITGFWERVTAAEDRFIDVLRSVDTKAEATDAATSSGRPDTGELINQLKNVGTEPAAITAWWNGLSDAEREALKISDPDLVGNLNGIPTGDRDEANRTSLQRDLDYLNGIGEDGEQLTDDQRRHLTNAESARDALNIPAAMGHDDVDVNLIVFQPTAFNGDGAAAVSYGDPDTADNTAVIVPGIMNDGASIAGQGRDAYTLYREGIRNGESMASIAWMGYDSPNWNPQGVLDYPGSGLDIGSVVTEDKAIAGGHALSDFVDGLRATDEGDRSHLSVIGHSYGSTTAAHAAAGDGLDADSLTLIGSPGAGGDDVNGVGDLHMPEGSVYAGSADNDFVSWLGRDGDLGMGQDPTQADFGAKVFGVDPGADFHAENIGQGVTNHTSYFAEDSQSLDNLTKIAQGDEPDIVGGRTQEANDYAKDWARDEVVHQADRAVDAVVDEVEETYEDGKKWIGDRWDDVTRIF